MLSQVHRWYAEGDQPGLVYGRRGEPDGGEGICVVKVYSLLTFNMPGGNPSLVLHSDFHIVFHIFTLLLAGR
jgi:hypothetical protein